MLSIVDAIFALVFGAFAWQARRRGWLLLKSGWLFLQTYADDGEAERSVERRRWISAGGNFFLGGALWLGAAVVAALLALQFALRAL